jgi:pimeloyl-ACP methyl ester carboxylesterase
MTIENHFIYLENLGFCPYILHNGNTDSNNIILLFHGLGSRKEWFFPLIEELSDYTCIAMDFLGHGDFKIKDPSKLNINTLKDQVEKFIKKLDLNDKKLLLFAHSMAGAPLLLFLKDSDRNCYYIHAEGNLDEGDLFLSSKIAQKPLNEFVKEGHKKFSKIIFQSSINDEYPTSFENTDPEILWYFAKDLIKWSKEHTLSEIAKELPESKCLFLFGEKNKGRFTSEQKIIKFGHNVKYVIDSGHDMAQESPEDCANLIANFLDSKIEKLK